jgi:hypothetical protein
VIAICRTPTAFQFFCGTPDEPWARIKFLSTPPVRCHFATARLSENEFFLIGGDFPSFEIHRCNHFTGECDRLTVVSPQTLPSQNMLQALSILEGRR